jgi:hypothetical protein
MNFGLMRRFQTSRAFCTERLYEGLNLAERLRTNTQLYTGMCRVTSTISNIVCDFAKKNSPSPAVVASPEVAPGFTISVIILKCWGSFAISSARRAPCLPWCGARRFHWRPSSRCACLARTHRYEYHASKTGSGNVAVEHSVNAFKMLATM